MLSKNQNVSENNRGLLVESLRSIAEILIWGDQNDSSVFEYVSLFIEKYDNYLFLNSKPYKIFKIQNGSTLMVNHSCTMNSFGVIFLHST